MDAPLIVDIMAGALFDCRACAAPWSGSEDPEPEPGSDPCGHQKIYLLIVMSTLLVTYVSTKLEKIMQQDMLQRAVLIMFLPAVSAFFFFALSTAVSRNRRRPSGAPALPHVVFLGDISGRAPAQAYVDAFRCADMHAVFSDICHRIYGVASVAREKYRSCRRAWLALLVEVTLFLLLEFSIAL